MKQCALLLLLFALSACSDSQNSEKDVNSGHDSVTQDARAEESRKEEDVASSAEKTQAQKDFSSNITSYDAVFDVDEDDVVMGNPNSSVVVIEYSSPTCSHCAYFHKEILPELKKNYIDTMKISYVIRQFISNKQDLDATILVFCGKKENATKMLDIFFTQQSSWAFNTNYRDILTNIGQLSGVTPDAYAKCLDNSELLGKITGKSRAVMRVPKFVGTPAFVIDGAFHDKSYSYQNLSEAIDAAIAKHSDKPSK